MRLNLIRRMTSVKRRKGVYEIKRKSEEGEEQRRKKAQ